MRASRGAKFYVLAHALTKSGLFLTVGAITEATGQDELAQIGGLAALVLAGGIVVGPAVGLASAAASLALGSLVSICVVQWD